MISWNGSLLERLNSLWLAKQLAPSLLITGDKGIGVEQTALSLSQLLRCRHAQQGKRCGTCHDCKLMDAGTHPDFFEVAAPEGKKQIGIDLVRKANEFATTRPQVSQCKVVLINQAEQLNTASANAVLKTLEEPADGVVFILATERPGQLLPTIRSRCQSYTVPLPTQEQSLQYLQNIEDAQALLALSRQRPLLAEAMVDTLPAREALKSLFAKLFSKQASPIEVAAAMVKIDVDHLLIWLQAWLVDLVKISLEQRQTLQDPEGIAELLSSSDMPSDALMRWVDQQISDISAMQRGQSLNLQSWLENLLIELTTMLWRARS